MFRSPNSRFARKLIPALCAAAGACLMAPGSAGAYDFDSSEAAFDATYAATPIDLTGIVEDELGQPMKGVSITVIGWGSAAANDGETAFTDAAGAFALPGLARRSVLLRVARPGCYTEIVPVDLHRPLTEPDTDAGVVALTRQRAPRSRIIFGGDTMFGRRFVDADEDGIEGEPGDLIQPATRAADAQALLLFMKDVLSSADYTQVNLESPVTANPATPHPYKSYVFFSYPETVGALSYAGVDAVSLGNNHMYDFLDSGVADTIAAVPSANLDWFGAGMNESAAKGSVLYRTLPGGVQVAFMGFDQIVNDGTTLPEYSLVARDAPGEKGGALELGTTNLMDFMTADAQGWLGIPVLHGGIEYSDYPSSGMRFRFTQLAQVGARMIVAHHPHTVHGIGLMDSGSGEPVVAFMSLGNLLFDQDVFETFQSYVAVVDVDQFGPGKCSIHRVQLIPIHIEGYVPKLVSGSWLARAGRQVGHLSTTLPAAPSPGEPADGLTGAVVFPQGPRIAVASSAAQVATSDAVESVNVPVTGLSTGAISYARTSPSDMLASVQTSAPMQCGVGREIAIYGDFEDADVDDAFHEGAMWTQSTIKYVQNSVVRSGVGAAVLLRSQFSTTPATLSMNNRIKLDPANTLTLQGFVKGSNAGPFEIEITWYSSSGANLSTSVV
jgi:poly-gamma-glutamate capsule biosynthesis protein CapA/YwtB (metallophosphatase superfamily)